MWYVYIVKCSNGTLYTGITTDVIRRIKEHNAKKGGAYTRTCVPVKLIHQESYPTKPEALKREAQIKGCTRKGKVSLINRGKTQ